MNASVAHHVQETTSMLLEANNRTHTTLQECVRQALGNYFDKLDGYDTTGLYQLVMAEVERPLFETVMEHTGGNQTHAAELLGISRSTLRKKLADFDLLP